MEKVRWVEKDRYGNEIYLTDERWEHITNPMNHPEMEECETALRETIRFGSRSRKCLIRKNIDIRGHLATWPHPTRILSRW